MSKPRLLKGDLLLPTRISSTDGRGASTDTTANDITTRVKEKEKKEEKKEKMTRQKPSVPADLSCSERLEVKARHPHRVWNSGCHHLWSSAGGRSLPLTQMVPSSLPRSLNNMHEDAALFTTRAAPGDSAGSIKSNKHSLTSFGTFTNVVYSIQ